MAGFVTGTAGNDTITDFRDVTRTVLTLGGNDTVNERAGDDSVDGGAGNDTLNGGTGDDTLLGGAGNDTINAGNGDDFALGGGGNDTLNGGGGDDGLVGGAGDDALNDGGGGDDYVIGNAGADTFVLGGGEDLAEVYDGDPTTVETVRGYDDDDDTILADFGREADDPEEEEPFDYFTISPTGSNSVRVRFFQDAGPGPDGGDVLVEVVNVVGGDAKLLDEGDVLTF